MVILMDEDNIDGSVLSAKGAKISRLETKLIPKCATQLADKMIENITCL